MMILMVLIWYCGVNNFLYKLCQTLQSLTRYKTNMQIKCKLNKNGGSTHKQSKKTVTPEHTWPSRPAWLGPPLNVYATTRL